MTPALTWSMLALAMAVASMAMGRDISCNVFLAAVFTIQALQPASRQPETASRVVLILSIGVMAFLLWSWATGVQFPLPKSWGARF